MTRSKLNRDAQHDGRRVIRLQISLIKPDPQNPRKRFNEAKLKSLAFSLSQYGQFEPIQVRHDERQPGKYVLISGERRWRAARLANLTHVDAIVEDVPLTRRVVAMVLSNVEREPLNPLEMARCFQELVKPTNEGGGGMSRDGAASAMGYDSGTVVPQYLSLLKLPGFWQDLIENGQLDWTKGREIYSFIDRPEVLAQFEAEYERRPSDFRRRDQIRARLRAIAGRPEQPLSAGNSEPLTQAQLEIVSAIREAGGRPLVTDDVLSALNRKLGEAASSATTVKIALSELVRRGILISQRHAPRGYLPGSKWSAALTRGKSVAAQSSNSV